MSGCPPAARVSRLRPPGDTDAIRHALPFLPRTLAVPLGAVFNRGRHCSVRIRRRQIPGRRHAGPGPETNNGDRPSRPLSLQPEPHVSGILTLQFRIAFWVNSLWLLATLAGALLLMHYVVIPREEQYLERRFGAEYLDYKASVRRWL